MAEITGYRATMWTDTATNLSTDNPTPLAGELVLESDTGVMKKGDGTTAYNDLPSYINTQEYPSDTSWTEVTSLDNGWTGEVWYIKRAGFVTITFRLDGTVKTSNVVLTLDSAYRPNITTVWFVINDSGTVVHSTIFDTGEIEILGSSSTIHGLVTYPVL